MKKYRDLPAQTRGEFEIPPGDVPTTTRCIMLQIPDSDAAYNQLAGVLYELTHWNNYQREPTHKATEWASAWRDAILAQPLFEGCDMSQLIQFRQDVCGLQVSYDEGENWETIYDATGCVNGIIDGLIDDGVLQRAGGQPSPTSPAPAGHCESYHVILRGNDKWKVPFPVSEGYTIAVSGAKGGWTDGAFLWYCYNGKSFVLGTCGNDNAYQENDPLQSGNHMALIGLYDEATPVAFDVLSGTYTIPEGVENQECWLQANDSQLYDNAGQIEFDVEVCTPGAVDCSGEIDFRSVGGTWRVGTMDDFDYKDWCGDESAVAVWSRLPGTGIVGSGYEGTHEPIFGILEFGQSCQITDIILDAGSALPLAAVLYRVDGVFVQSNSYQWGTNPHTFHASPAKTCDAIGIIEYGAGTLIAESVVWS